MDNALVPMLARLVDKVSRMRPIPPCDDLFDPSWGKVDKLIIKTMKAMQEKGVEKPLHPLSNTFLSMALKDVADNGLDNVTPALQAVAYRAMDTRLLVDEFARMRLMTKLIYEAAKGEKVEFPFYDFPPKHPMMMPPCFDAEVYNDGAAWVVESFAEELRRRNILPQKKEDD